MIQVLDKHLDSFYLWIEFFDKKIGGKWGVVHDAEFTCWLYDSMNILKYSMRDFIGKDLSEFRLSNLSSMLK